MLFENGLSAIRLTIASVENVELMHYNRITPAVFVSCFHEVEALPDVKVQPLQHFTSLMLQTGARRQGQFILLGCKNIHCDKILLCLHLSSGHGPWSATTATLLSVRMGWMLQSVQPVSLQTCTRPSKQTLELWISKSGIKQSLSRVVVNGKTMII